MTRNLFSFAILLILGSAAGGSPIDAGRLVLFAGGGQGREASFSSATAEIRGFSSSNLEAIGRNDDSFFYRDYCQFILGRVEPSREEKPPAEPYFKLDYDFKFIIWQGEPDTGRAKPILEGRTG